MTTDLDPLLKRLSLANGRRVWRDLIQRAEREQWSHHQLLETLLAEEIAHRRATRLTKATRHAGFPFLRTIDEFDFTYQSTLRLTTIGSLLAPDFVTEGRSVILFGKPGRGKTHLAVAIAYRALQNGFDARFTTAAELIDDLSAASRDGRMREAIVDYVRPHVLVVDEVGYLTYGGDAANVLYHVVNDRHIRRRAMIFTTNKPPKHWGQALHDEDLAEAIVDRILERGRLLRLDGRSVRTEHLDGDDLVSAVQDNSTSRRFSGIPAAEFPEPTDRPFGHKGPAVQLTEPTPPAPCCPDRRNQDQSKHSARSAPCWGERDNGRRAAARESATSMLERTTTSGAGARIEPRANAEPDISGQKPRGARPSSRRRNPEPRDGRLFSQDVRTSRHPDDRKYA